MSPNRREFLKNGAALAAGAVALESGLLSAAAHAAPPASRPARLFFDEAEVPRIRKVLATPRFSEFWRSCTGADLAVDRKFLRDELRLNNHSKDFLQARLILERTAFVYAITRDKAQLDVARLALQRMLEYTKWDYFLEGGKDVIGLQRAPETTIAMTCALEWLDDALSASEKVEIEKQIAEKGAPACYRTLYGMKYPDRVKGWGFDPEDDYPYRFDLSRWPFILNATNLKVIPVAGLGLAGCLLYDKHPQARHWVEFALQSAQAYSLMFGPDGSYDEGVGYWGYTAMHMTLLAETLRRRLGTNTRSLLNFPGTVRYGLRMDFPTVRKGDCVNFGDAWSMGDIGVAAWTAREFRDGIAQHVALNVGEVKNHFAAIWFDPALKPKRPGADLHDVRFSNDIVVARSGWGVEDAVVAFRSGGPANHEHADRNSVIFKCYGERLLHDPYKAAYSHTDPHWKLRLPESHTLVLIDGKGHQYHDGKEGTNASWAESRILKFESASDRMIAVSDATPAYALVNPDVGRVRRTVIYLKPRVLILFDEIDLARPLPVQARFQVDNSDGHGRASTAGSAFTIHRPGARLAASVAGSGTLAIGVSTIDVPAQYGDHPFVEVTSGSSARHAIVTVCTALRPAEKDLEVAIERTGESWRVTVPGTTKRLTVEIIGGGELPTLAIG